VDYGTPFHCPFIVQGDVEEAMSRSSEPRRCDQRAGFECPVVTGQAVDRVFYEFLRQPHLFDIVQSWPKDNRRKVTSQIASPGAGMSKARRPFRLNDSGRPALIQNPDAADLSLSGTQSALH